VSELVAGFGADTPIVAVSALRMSGLDALRASLVTQLGKAAARSESDVFRMPIDRVFSVRGTGTVVTGTVWSGRAGHHDVARVLPQNLSARIRAVQTHGVNVEQAGAGGRAAFALTGIERSEVARGAVLVTSAAWGATTVLTVRTSLLPGIQLKHRQRVRVHLGTAEVMARVVLLAGHWVQLRLEAPIVARSGDRLILRSYSPVSTIGGGQVAEMDRARKTLDQDDQGLLARLLDDIAHERMRAAVALSNSASCPIDALPLRAAVSPSEVAEFTGRLPGDVVSIGTSLMAASVLEQAVEQLVGIVTEHHRAHPLEAGIERAVWLRTLPASWAETAGSLAVTRGRVTAHGSRIALTGFNPDFAPRLARLRDQLLEHLRAGGLAPPNVTELKRALRSDDVQAVLRLLEAQGRVTAVALDLYVESGVLAGAIEDVRSRFGDGGPLPPAEFKVALPVSRKYLIPLLEYFDRVGITKREGELRHVVNS
jgi:selenocysteine-specific elongation factor